MSRVRCRSCRKQADTDPCWWCTRTCSRKKRYATYNQAKEARLKFSPRLWDDPTLQVYRCTAATSGEHFHIGHATGQRGRQVAKRAEKFRRKALVEETLGTGRRTYMGDDHWVGRDALARLVVEGITMAASPERSEFTPEEIGGIVADHIITCGWRPGDDEARDATA